MIRTLVLFSISLSLMSCGMPETLKKTFSGGEDNNAKPMELQTIHQRLSVVKVWEKDVGKGTDELYLKLMPTISDGKIFSADTKGNVIAFDVSKGKVIWKTDVDEKITGGPGASFSTVAVGTNEGHVIALSAENGTELWKSRVSSEVLSAPQIADGIIVVRTIDGNVFGLDEKAGKRLWIYDRTVPALTLRGTSAPIIADDMVIAGFDGGKLAALELESGKLIWEVRVSMGSGRSELDRMVDIDAEPVVREGVIYVSTFQGRISAVDLTTGRLIWFRDIPSYAGLSVDSRYVYVTDDDSHIWALDKFSGNSIWKNEKLESRAVTGPTIFDQYVVLGDLEGYVHWLDSRTGDFIARHRLGKDRIIAPAVVSNEILYVYSSNGTLGAYTYQGAMERADSSSLRMKSSNETHLSESDVSEEILKKSTRPEESAAHSSKSEDEIIMDMLKQQEKVSPAQAEHIDAEIEADSAEQDKKEKKSLFQRMMEVFSDDDEKK